LVEHGSIAVLSPEGGVFDVMGGRYSGEPNIDVYLKAHTGESLRVDRMNRPSEYVARPILTLCLTVQPVVLKRLAEKRDFRGRGLVARFLYSIPSSLLGRRAINPPLVPPDLSHRYEQLLRTLLSSAGGPSRNHEYYDCPATHMPRGWHSARNTSPVLVMVETLRR